MPGKNFRLEIRLSESLYKEFQKRYPNMSDAVRELMVWSLSVQRKAPPSILYRSNTGKAAGSDRAKKDAALSFLFGDMPH
jgi:hypothetical protein